MPSVIEAPVNILLSGMLLGITAFQLSPMMLAFNVVSYILPSRANKDRRGKLIAVIVDRKSRHALDWILREQRQDDFIHLIVLDPICNEEPFDADNFWSVAMDYGVKQACGVLKAQKCKFDGQTVKVVDGIDPTDFLKDILAGVQPEIVVLGSKNDEDDRLATEMALESPYTIAIVK